MDWDAPGCKAASSWEWWISMKFHLVSSITLPGLAMSNHLIPTLEWSLLHVRSFQSSPAAWELRVDSYSFLCTWPVSSCFQWLVGHELLGYAWNSFYPFLPIGMSKSLWRREPQRSPFTSLLTKGALTPLCFSPYFLHLPYFAFPRIYSCMEVRGPLYHR